MTHFSLTLSSAVSLVVVVVVVVAVLDVTAGNILASLFLFCALVPV